MSQLYSAGDSNRLCCAKESIKDSGQTSKGWPGQIEDLGLSETRTIVQPQAEKTEEPNAGQTAEKVAIASDRITAAIRTLRPVRFGAPKDHRELGPSRASANSSSPTLPMVADP